jgi:hypothetical protein
MDLGARSPAVKLCGVWRIGQSRTHSANHMRHPTFCIGGHLSTPAAPAQAFFRGWVAAVSLDGLQAATSQCRAPPLGAIAAPRGAAAHRRREAQPRTGSGTPERCSDTASLPWCGTHGRQLL